MSSLNNLHLSVNYFYLFTHKLKNWSSQSFLFYDISTSLAFSLLPFLPPFQLSVPTLRSHSPFPLFLPLSLSSGATQVNMLVTELKSEALKERHWKQLMKRLRVMWQLHDLTLGQVLE